MGKDGSKRYADVVTGPPRLGAINRLFILIKDLNIEVGILKQAWQPLNCLSKCGRQEDAFNEVPAVGHRNKTAGVWVRGVSHRDETVNAIRLRFVWTRRILIEESVLERVCRIVPQ